MSKFQFKDQDSLLSFMRENILTRREAESFLGISKQSFSRSLKKGKFNYFKSVGEGKGQVQLYFKNDLEAYRQELLTNLKKYNKEKGEG